MRSYYLYTGTVGWSHLAWHARLYSEDLPTDWRLSFYNTQFRCVYLPYLIWQSASDEQVAFWLSETQEDFHFVLGKPDEGTVADLERSARFGERGKLENEVDIFWLESGTSLRALARIFNQSVEAGRSLYVVAKNEDLAQLRQAEELMNVMGL